MKYTLAFLLPILSSFVFFPIIIRLSRKYGLVAKPREDRWHKEPTASFGGIGIYLSLLFTMILFVPATAQSIAIIGCVTAVFFLGLIDDIRPIKPQYKFLVETVLAVVIIYFSPIFGQAPYPVVTLPLIVLWIVGITNAINFLDNMDGLSSGVSLVASLFLMMHALHGGMEAMALFACMSAGITIGFLRYNLNPAKIFMGDCGSLVLGFLLAVVSTMGIFQNGYHTLFHLAAPIAVMAVPLFDTTLVTVDRILHGRPFYLGGTDHSSHRLVNLGLSEKNAVFVLMGIGVLSGSIGAPLMWVSPHMSLVFAAILFVCLFYFGIFMGQVEVYEEDALKPGPETNRFMNILLHHKEKFAQAVIDAALISLAFGLSTVIACGKNPSMECLQTIFVSLPFILVGKMAVFAGLPYFYRVDWRWLKASDFFGLTGGVTMGSLAGAAALVFLSRIDPIPIPVLLNDYLLTLLFIGGVRVLLRFYQEYFFFQGRRKNGSPVLIFGAGNAGVRLVREMKHQYMEGVWPVGFIDDDSQKRGKIIQGLRVLGTREDIPRLVEKHGIKGLLIPDGSKSNDRLLDVYKMCSDLDLECKEIVTAVEL